MAFFLSQPRLLACFLFLVLHFCFASSLELPSLRKLHQDGEVSMIKRAVGKTFEIPFDVTTYYGEVYGFNCSIGTPPQNVQIGLSVFKSDSQLSMNITRNPWNTAYNITLSTSSNPLLEWIEITYLSSQYSDTPNSNIYDTEWTHVFYATDNLQIAGTNTSAILKDMPFVSYSNTTLERNNTVGIDDFKYNWIGLGLATGQAIINYVFEPQNGKPYPTFAQQFINTSQIESNTYSIWLDPPSQKSGHLLLGGLNSKRYKGTLTNLPASINTTSNDWGLKLQNVLSVGISSFSANGAVIPNTTVEHAVLAHDSNTYLPSAAARAIWDAVGASYNPAFNLDQLDPIVPCSYLTNASTISLAFSGANFTLPIPMSAITSKGGEGPLGDSGSFADTCVILIKAVKLGLPAMLGSNVLRGLYTVYDLDNKIISVALTDFDAKEDNVIAIPVEGVAGIKKEAFGSATPSPTTPGVTPSDTGTPPVDGEKRGNNTVAIGVGVAVPIVVIAAMIAAFFLWRRRKARKDEIVTKKDNSEGNEAHAKAELADDQKPHAEAMGKEVSEVEGEGRMLMSWQRRR